MSFINRYKPKTYNEIIGNNKRYISIEKEILEGERNKFIITGKKSLGKTTFVEIFSKKNNYKLFKYSIDDNLDENIFQYSFFIKKIILIDDIKLNNIKYKDKNKIITKIKNITSIINKVKNVIIILISDKNIKEFKKIEDVVIFNIRKYKNELLVKHIKHICNNENIKYSNETYEKIFQKIIDISDENIEKIYINIETLLMKNKKTIKFNEKTREKIKNREQDKKVNDSFILMNKVFENFNINNIKELNEKEQLYYNEPFIVSSHLRENYIKLSKYSKNNINIIKNISENLCDGDIINKFIDEKQRYELSKYSTYMNGIVPMYYLQGKYKCFFTFPSVINKDNNILNNYKKLQGDEYKNLTLYEKNYLKKNKII